MGRLTCGVELFHPGTENSPVVSHHCGQHRRHPDDYHHGRDLDFCHLLLKHVAAQCVCAVDVCMCVHVRVFVCGRRTETANCVLAE